MPTDPASAQAAGSHASFLSSVLRAVRPAGWVAAAAIGVAVAVLLDVLNSGLLVSLDHAVSRTMRDWGLREGWTYHLIYPLTWFGQRGPVLIVAVPLVAWLSYRARSVEPFARLVLALALLTVTVYALKYGVGRDAPPTDGLHTDTGRSFPSGHLGNSVLMWGLIAWLSARDAGVPALIRQSAAVLRFAGPLAVVVGMTLLDFHWISDFAAGAAIGVALLWLVTAPVPARAVTSGRRIRPSAAP